MGIDYTAYTVIGSRINSEDMFIEGKVRDCYHKLPSENAKYCSECGKQAYRKAKVYKIPELEEVYNNINGFDLLLGNEYSDFYFGVIQKSTVNDNEYTTEIPDIVDLKNKLKEFLYKYDLWDDELFGIHTILYVS